MTEDRVGKLFTMVFTNGTSRPAPRACASACDWDSAHNPNC
jgi:hypothetical protein